MESSPYDEAYNIDDDEEPSQVDMYTPSPRNPKQNTRQANDSKIQGVNIRFTCIYDFNNTYLHKYICTELSDGLLL